MFNWAIKESIVQALKEVNWLYKNEIECSIRNFNFLKMQL